MSQEILEGLATIVNEVAGTPVSDITPEKSFVDDLDIDSLSMVEVVMAAEDKFGVSIPDGEVKNLKTVGDAVAYIEKANGLRLIDRRGTAPARNRRPASYLRTTARRIDHLDRTRARSTPMTSQRRVVVTGLGATTPVGGDVASTWDGLLAGRSGVRSLDRGAVRRPARALRRPGGRRPHRRCSSGPRRASSTAASSSPSSPRARPGPTRAAPEVDPERLGVVVASGIGGIVSLLEQDDILKTRGWSRVSPMTVPMLMPNGASRVGRPRARRQGRRPHPGQRLRVRRRGGERGPRHDPQRPRRRRARRRHARRASHPLTIAAFAAMRALSTRNDEPERATRPYDKGRDGFVMGEGAGMLVLESAEHAAARGATGVRRGRRRRPHRRRPPHRAARPRGQGRHPRDPDGARGRGPVARRTSSTSTRTPPRPRRATSPRPPRSARSSARPSTARPSAAPSR